MDIPYNNEFVYSYNKDSFYGQIMFFNPHLAVSKIFYCSTLFCNHLQTDFKILF